MDVFFILPWIIVFICLCSEAFFAAAELSIVSSNELELDRLQQSGDLRAQRVLWFKSKPDRLFGTTLLGTNISTVTGSTVASLTLLHWDPQHGEWWAMLIMTPLVLIGAEIMPKTIGQARANRVSRRLAGPLFLVSQIATPLLFLVHNYTALLYRLLNIDTSTHGIAISREELILLANADESPSELEDEEREMITRILEFGDLQAADSLVPLTEIVAIEVNQTVQEAIDLIARNGFSRLPVFESRIDNIVGLLHHLDLLTCDDGSLPVARLMRPAHFVPQSQDIDEILYLLKREATTAAIVVDEFGGAVGLLTLEDILEEIVGEIRDEHDQDTGLWREIDSGLLLSGRTSIERLTDELSLEIPNSNEYETIAGFLLSRFKRIPRIGERLEIESGAILVIQRASNRAIEEVLLIQNNANGQARILPVSDQDPQGN